MEYSNISITLANNCDILRCKCVCAVKSDPLFHIKLYPRTTQDSLSLFLSLFPIFSPTFLMTKTLVIGSAPDLSMRVRESFPTLIRDHFHFFGTLHTLSAKCDIGDSILPLLASTSTDEAPSPNRRMIFPELKKIIVMSLWDLYACAYVAWRAKQGFPVELITCDS